GAERAGGERDRAAGVGRVLVRGRTDVARRLTPRVDADPVGRGHPGRRDRVAERDRGSRRNGRHRPGQRPLVGRGGGGRGRGGRRRHGGGRGHGRPGGEHT